MELRTLGRDGPLVSSLGLGCVTFGREIDRDAAFAVMDRALERGITLFDTAEVYARGASETIVGEWLAARGTRQQIVLATKVAGALTRERVLASAEASCRRLQTDAVDVCSSCIVGTPTCRWTRRWRRLKQSCSVAWRAQWA